MSASKRILCGIYETYTGSLSSPMTSSKFMKLMKDSNLLDQNLRQPDVDLIFTKCKDKGQKAIDLEGFKRGLEMVAGRKGVSYTELLDYMQMTTADGPSYAGATIAQETRFYDDKDTYTGVHKAGGPTVVDRDKQGLENLLDRSDADVRGLKRDMKEAHGRPVMAGRRGEVPAESGYSPQASPAPSPSYHSRSAGAPAGHTPTALPRGNSHEALIDNLEGRLKRLSTTPPNESSRNKTATRQALSAHISSRVTPPSTPSTSLPSHGSYHATPNTPPAPPASRSRIDLPPPAPERIAPQTPTRDTEAALYEVYKTFCTNNPVTFLIPPLSHTVAADRRLWKWTQLDLIFQKAKKAGNYAKRITYEDFRMVAIPELAKRIGCSVEEIFAVTLRSDGPSLNNTTTPSDVRFHDDVSTYTGVHAEGHNPTFTPTSSRIALEDLLDRSPADNRGIKLSAEAAAAASAPHSAQKPKRAVIAGEANKAGGIYDRLSQQDSYTGVYRERFQQQPVGHTQEFRGHTNTATDEPIHDISRVLNRR